jgi:riboflavin synthase
MFTGLVESVGTIDDIVSGSAGLELSVSCAFNDIVVGESIAVNGACLTVRDCRPGSFSVAAVVTTLERTAIGHWRRERRVNLERALRVGDRLGGHLLQGHVDCVGRAKKSERRGDAMVVDVELNDDVWEALAPRGSIAIDGVSLTVNELPSRGLVQVSLIEHTLSHTTLADLSVGDEVHVEGDILGKHVRHFLGPYLERVAATMKE